MASRIAEPSDPGILRARLAELRRELTETTALTGTRRRITTPTPSPASVAEPLDAPIVGHPVRTPPAFTFH